MKKLEKRRLSIQLWNMATRSEGGGGELSLGSVMIQAMLRDPKNQTYTLHYWPILARNMCAVLVCAEAGFKLVQNEPP